ncbi:MAG: hypothetical protein AB7X49_22710, partial [Geminicoccaceae bacterium]
MRRSRQVVLGALIAAGLCLGVCMPSLAEGVPDEAKIAGRTVQSFPPADEDYFRGMDNGLELSADEIKGRNMWLLWTGGNDRFWDR